MKTYFSDKKPNQAALDLLAAIQVVAVGDVVPPGWFTAIQLATECGLTPNQVCKKLSTAVRNGKCEAKRFRVKCGSLLRPCLHYKKL